MRTLCFLLAPRMTQQMCHQTDHRTPVCLPFSRMHSNPVCLLRSPFPISIETRTAKTVDHTDCLGSSEPQSLLLTSQIADSCVESSPTQNLDLVDHQTKQASRLSTFARVQIFAFSYTNRQVSRKAFNCPSTSIDKHTRTSPEPD